MNLMGFFVTFGFFILTTFLLYFVGHLFTLPWLTFNFVFANSEKGFNLSIGSLYPVFIGLIVSYFAEKIYDAYFFKINQ